MTRLAIDIPEPMACILEPARYKAFYGGRGGGKSWGVAAYLVARALSGDVRILCIREVQRSIRDSSKKIIEDTIRRYNLSHCFEIQTNSIYALDAHGRRKPKGEFLFIGMQDHTAQSIKSIEAVDIAWCDEAQTIRQRSLDILRPTIRGEGRELVFTWNPRHQSDAVDDFFRGNAIRPDGRMRRPPEDAIIVEVHMDQNPWAPPDLVKERAEDYANDPDKAAHVWGGDYERVGEAAYYARLISAAEQEGRLGDFPYDPSQPVHTSWDLGVADYSVCWFFQIWPRGIRFIDFWQTSGVGVQQFLAEALPEYSADLGERYKALARIGREQSYRYGQHHLPHDVRVREWGNAARSRVEVLTDLGLPIESIRVGAAQDPEERIQAVRRMIPMAEFNTANPNVALGIQHLRRYSRRMNEQMGVYVGPRHDEHSHAADAIGEAAVNAPLPCEPQPKADPPKQPLGQVYLPGPPEIERGTRIRL